MSVLIVGSVAFDSIKTPMGVAESVLGGSASYASIAASYFASPVRIVGIVGCDFGRKNINMFKRKKIDIDGLHISTTGKTFHWKGEYEGAMNEAKTHSTCLNVFATFQPNLNNLLKESKYIFLANIDPVLQLHVLQQLKKPRLVVCDTMNFWIQSAHDELIKVIKKSDVILLNEHEARQLVLEHSLSRATQKILRLGKARWVIIKKGEHGAIVCSRTGQFVVPAFPTMRVKDPTGAGDTFAGAFTGWISFRQKIDELTIRQAAIIGSTMASFTIEDFSVKKLYRLTHEKIFERAEHLQRMLECPPIKSLIG